MSAALTPDSIRQAIRARAIVPSQMLDKALAKVMSQLEAKETKFFAHQGAVMDTREVDSHSIQQGAARLIVEMAEILVKGPPKPPARKTRIVIDPKTGVMSIIIDEEYETEAFQEAPDVIDITPKEIEKPAPQPEPVPEPEPIPEPEPVVNQTEEEPDFDQHIKISRGVLSPEIRQALFGSPKSDSVGK